MLNQKRLGIGKESTVCVNIVFNIKGPVYNNNNYYTCYYFINFSFFIIIIYIELYLPT